MRAIFVIILALVFSDFCGEKSVAQPQEEGYGRMKLTSPSFTNGAHIPAKFTGEGPDINPALDVEDLPAGTKSLALIVDDPDAPMKTWVHWVVYDIPPASHIDENSVPGRQGMNDSGGKNYHGPYPPSGTHRYYFKIYALDKVLKLREGI
jgi:Raf kinase inhibitor-like YbhB/YbcL family protein